LHIQQPYLQVGRLEEVGNYQQRQTQLWSEGIVNGLDSIVVTCGVRGFCLVPALLKVEPHIVASRARSESQPPIIIVIVVIIIIITHPSAATGLIQYMVVQSFHSTPISTSYPTFPLP